MFRLAGVEAADERVVDCVTEIRFAIDSDRDWDISKQEFVKNGKKSKATVALMTCYWL